MSADVIAIDGSVTTPKPTPGTLTMTDKAADTVRLWLLDESTSTNDLTHCLMTLLRMGARGYYESTDLVTFDTPSLTVGMYRDRKGGVSLNS